jgi:quercetin dioxygenase-like cupin family protein
MKRSLPIALVASFALAAAADHQEGKPADLAKEMGIYDAAELPWKEAPPSLPKGAMAAVLEGDPAVEGLFTMRFRFPSGYQIAPHFHSQIEHVTVLAGTLHFGMGEKFDRANTRPMPTGSFGYWPPGMRHFGWTEGETILQLHGKGPWTITYVDPADDPRR